MPPAADKFLPNPASIKRALRAALADADELDMAVAFVGKDWDTILGGYRGLTRVVCWLSNTATNPSAVEKMMKLRTFKVRQVEAMHAKVYLPRGDAAVAIVGSANLSARALADEGTRIQHEAGVLMREASIIRETSAWFEELWKESARAITKKDLADAKEAWSRARREPAPSEGELRDAAADARRAAESITMGMFLNELASRPKGAILEATARSILAAARRQKLHVNWSEFGFSLYSEEERRGVSLLGVSTRRRDRVVSVGVRRWMSGKKNEEVGRLVKRVLRGRKFWLSRDKYQHGFHLEELSGRETRLVTELVAIARG